MKGQERTRHLLDGYWRCRIFKICLILAGVTFVAEIIYLLAGILGLAEIEDIRRFALRYILVPTVIDFGGIIIARKALDSKRFSVKVKNRIVCYLAFLLTAVIACTHYSYAETTLTPCIVVIFAALLVDVKLCRNIQMLSYAVLIIASAERYMEGITVGFRAVVSLGIIAAAIHCSYQLAILLAQYERTQLWLLSRGRKQKVALMEQIRIEPTTGLLSRRVLMDTLEQQCKAAKNHSEPMYLAMVDIDNFKKINDTYGHTCGDEVLRKIGRIIRENVKGTAEGFRYGGEEFVILFRQKDMEDVVRMMEKIRVAMAKSRFDFLGQDRITVSCGIAEYQKGMRPTEWICRADHSLYQAKHEGKNRVIVNLEQAG